MTTTTSLTTIKVPTVFEVFFYENKRGGTLAERLFAKANRDYHRMFMFKGCVVHLSVRLGEYVYEVTEEGTVKYPWTEELLDDERMVGFYTLDIGYISSDKRLAALFTLENMIGRKLDIEGCMRYLWQAIGLGKSNDYMTAVGFNAKQDLNLKPGNFSKNGRKIGFNLPFTCASLVNVVLYHLFNFEPGFYGHLAQASTMSLSLLADSGCGSMYDLDTEQWLVGGENG